MKGSTHDSKIEFTYQVLQILRATDEKHPLNAKQVKHRLEEHYGIFSVGRRRIYAAQNLLIGMGYPIIKCENMKLGVYMEGAMTLSEWKMLLDVVQQSKLYTESARKAVLKKLYDGMPPEQRKILISMPELKAKYNARDEGIWNYIDILLKCIHRRKRVTFLYQAYEIDMSPKFKHHMKYYRISPYNVCFSHNTCYLIGSEREPDEGIDQMKHFRLDRICNLSEDEGKYIGFEEYYGRPATDISDYVYRCIDHYGGDEVILRLDVAYSEKAMYIIRDMCGDEYDIQRLEEKHAIISFRIRTGPPLIGWLMQNARLFTVVGPDSVVDAVREEYRYGYEKFCRASEMGQ